MAALRDTILHLPFSTTSSTPLSEMDAAKNRAFIATFIDNPWFQVYGGFKCINRPGHFSVGKPAPVAINSHRIAKYPQFTIYQYDVSTNQRVDYLRIS